MKKAEIKLAGRYKMIARKADGSGERVVADWFENEILDIGLNRMGTGQFLGHCRVGSGNTAPDAAQTSLVAQAAATDDLVSTTAGHDTVSNEYTKLTHVYRFGVGEATGTHAEVGVGWADSGATLFSRALIVDVDSDPTTITILADEILDVVYELRHYFPTVDSTFTLNISGTDYDCTLRPAGIADNPNLHNTVIPLGDCQVYDGALGTRTGFPSGAVINIGPATTTPAYSNNSLEQHLRMVVEVDEVMDIQSAVLSTSLGSYQCEFDPPIPKTNTTVLTLNWIISWARRA